MKPIVRHLPVLLVLMLAAGCSLHPAPIAETPTGEAVAATDYDALASQPGAKVYVLDPGQSWLRIYAFRGGKAAFAGHDHVLSSPDFSGHVYLPDKLKDARFDLEFSLASLIIDDAAMRAEAGGEFSHPLDANDIAGTRAHMLGADNLDAARFPTLRVHCENVVGDLPHLVATVQLNLHGQSRSMLIPLEVSLDKDQLRARGALAIRQTDFGIKPYAVLGGLLSVQDEISIAFDLAAHAPKS
jgi:polyisoprenoid-binding protein YceI